MALSRMLLCYSRRVAMLAVDLAADHEDLDLREQRHAGRCRAHAQPCGRFGAGRAADRLTRARRARLCFAMRPWCCCSAGGSGGRSWSRGGSRKPVLNERLLARCRRRRRRLRRWWWGRGRGPPPAKAPVQQRALVFYTCPSRPLRPPSDDGAGSQLSVVQFVVQDLWQSHMQFWSQFALPVCHFESLSATPPSRVSLL